MKNKTLIFLILITVLTISSCMNMDNLPEGEFMKTVYSPEGTYKINAFLALGNATVDFSVRCEVVEISSGEKRNIYWQYRCDSADIEWIDNTTVVINEKRLNVLTDSYDWRD